MSSHNERKFQCPWCPLKFFRQKGLDLHIEKHEKDGTAGACRVCIAPCVFICGLGCQQWTTIVLLSVRHTFLAQTIFQKVMDRFI